MDLKENTISVLKGTERMSSCRAIFTPTNTVGDGGTECLLFSIKLDFTTLLMDFLGKDFGIC